MDNILFSTTDQRVVVSGPNTDGEFVVFGQYDGISIKRAIPLEGGNRCVLLLDPDTNPQSAFQNLLCIDRKGRPVWIARLPENPDVFVDVSLSHEGVCANSWSCFKLVLDPNTGAELKAVFTK